MILVVVSSKLTKFQKLIDNTPQYLLNKVKTPLTTLTNQVNLKTMPDQTKTTD